MSDRFAWRRDGFELDRGEYKMPDNFPSLTDDGKLAAAVCDMFVNGGFTVSTISHLLEQDPGNVVKTLLAHHIVKDRRVTYRNLS